MNKIYKFSPIKSKGKLFDVIDYVSRNAEELCIKIIGKSYSIKSLTIFSHYQSEYKFLLEIMNKLGSIESEHNGLYFSLSNPIITSINAIKLIRIRKPDPYRMQVGCNDFDIPDYQKFKSEY